MMQKVDPVLLFFIVRLEQSDCKRKIDLTESTNQNICPLVKGMVATAILA